MPKFEMIDNVPQNAVIKVVGVGGGGGNAVEHMVANHVEGVEFICANTDAQALKRHSARTLLQLGSQVTKGLGAGANPEIGRQAAIEDRDRIAEMLQGADMVFITAGMGGGTGTGGAPVVAEVARSMGILTVAVVTKPFPFEGPRRMKAADHGIAALAEHVDSLITIPNEKLLTVLGPRTSMLEAFKAANDVLLGAVKGIADLILHPGMINVDFADVRTVMSEMGMAMMGTGTGRGENGAREAAERALHSPLLDDVHLQGAKGILVNVTHGLNFSMGDFTDVGNTVNAFAAQEAQIIVGTTLDESMGDEVRVTVVATGIGRAALRLVDPAPAIPAQPAAARVTTQPQGATRTVAQPAADAARPNYADFDRPPALRQRAQGGAAAAPAAKPAGDMDFLDIPAFLRRQAD
ncbi:MAG: cell division protein FtsZ [Gammaproteobacteria bacterium]